jgi:hypothetical protein
VAIGRSAASARSCQAHAATLSRTAAHTGPETATAARSPGASRPTGTRSAASSGVDVQDGWDQECRKQYSVDVQDGRNHHQRAAAGPASGPLVRQRVSGPGPRESTLAQSPSSSLVSSAGPLGDSPERLGTSYVPAVTFHDNVVVHSPTTQCSV